MKKQLYFITGNKGKFEEVQSLIPEMKQLDIELPEIQEIDPRKIVEYKLKEAFKHADGEFIVEDTSLYFDALNGLPGPFIKWFLKTIGLEKMVHITSQFNNNGAVAQSVIGYARNKDEMYFFEGKMNGSIVNPKGSMGFGWDPIYQPEGYTKTLAEMNLKEKIVFSMRTIAAKKLKKFLEENISNKS